MKRKPMRGQLQVHTVFRSRTVQSIADDRMPQRGQVAANLVFASRLDSHVQ